MRASPAFQVSVIRFGVWRVTVLALLGASAAVLIGWLGSRDEFTPRWVQLAVGTAGLLLWLAGLSLLCNPPLSLRWDSQRWHLGPLASAGDEPWPGSLAVAL